MRTKLTDRFIANVQPPKKGRLEFNDTLEPGHVFSVTEHDHRAFSVRVWTGPKDKRKQRRVLIGHPREIDGSPKLTLAEAREGARSIKQAAAEGRALVPGDGVKGAQTWGQLSEEYITWAAENRRPSTAEEIKRIMRSADLAEWYDRPSVRISADDVRALRDRVHERGASMATKTVRIISGMGNWAVDEGKLPANPTKGVRARSPEKARERVLTDAEIGVFWRACDRLGYPYGKIAQLLLSPQERREMLIDIEVRARQFVREYWPDIVRLADVLHARGWLNERQIRAVLSRPPAVKLNAAGADLAYDLVCAGKVNWGGFAWDTDDDDDLLDEEDEGSRYHLGVDDDAETVGAGKFHYPFTKTGGEVYVQALQDAMAQGGVVGEYAAQLLDKIQKQKKQSLENTPNPRGWGRALPRQPGDDPDFRRRVDGYLRL
jgi:hypothetical protein